METLNASLSNQLKKHPMPHRPKHVDVLMPVADGGVGNQSGITAAWAPRCRAIACTLNGCPDTAMSCIDRATVVAHRMVAST
jgi:hypothetical protein